MGAVLILCGIVAVAIAGWRSYALAREALAPFIHDGDPTRTAIERSQPLPMRPRVRGFVRSVILSVGWLIVGLYGLYFLAVGRELAR